MLDSKIKILVVDDSSLMRLIISDILSEDNTLKVVDTAVNGLEAIEKTKLLKPDVILLDLVMDEYDGLYAVKNIMEHYPTPIVILSSLGNVDPNAVVEAFNAGAYDFLNKPTGVLNPKVREIKEQIIAKVKQASTFDIRKLKERKNQRNVNPHTFDEKLNFEAIVIGASTGGTGAIESILEKLPGNLPIPLFIAQHMPEEFIFSFANRLNDIIPLPVKVAKEGENIKGGVIYLAPGHKNMIVNRRKSNKEVIVETTDEKFKEFNNPSIDCLMQSVAETYGKAVIGVILTGMGRDGAKGLSAVSQKGGLTIVQDAKTSVVFGMPKAAIETGHVQNILSLNEIPNFIVSCL